MAKDALIKGLNRKEISLPVINLVYLNIVTNTGSGFGGMSNKYDSFSHPIITTMISVDGNHENIHMGLVTRFFSLHPMMYRHYSSLEMPFVS